MRTDYRPAFRNITLILLLGLLSVRPALAPRQKVRWEAGVLVGVDADTPDRTLRVEIDYEF